MLDQIEDTILPADQSPRVPQSLRGMLPPRMKTLYITTLQRPGGWLAEALASDSASEVILEEAIGVTTGLARLRDEVFDAILVSHEPGVLDALELVEGHRAGGGEEPMIVLGVEPAQDLLALCYEVGADDYCYVPETTVRALIWTLARAVERQTLLRENRRMAQAQRAQLQHEHQEAQRLLDQQRSLITDLKSLSEKPEQVQNATRDQNLDNDLEQVRQGFTLLPEEPLLACNLPDRLIDHYRELLRAYVIMGAGNLSKELAALAETLVVGGVTARQTMQLHIGVLEEMIRSLGNRSARHVMNRADLIAMEVMIHLAEGYRRCYLRQTHPLRQLELPGFDEVALVAFC